MGRVWRHPAPIQIARIKVLTGQQHRHRLGVDRADEVVGLGGENSEQEMLAFLFAAQAGPSGPSGWLAVLSRMARVKAVTASRDLVME
jgi:hypothetical protein